MIPTLPSSSRLTSLAAMSRQLLPLHFVNSEPVLRFHLPASIPNNYVITLFCSCICTGAAACTLALYHMSHQINMSIRFSSFFRSVPPSCLPLLAVRGDGGEFPPWDGGPLHFAALFTMMDLRDGCCSVCVCVCVCVFPFLSLAGLLTALSSHPPRAPLVERDKDTTLFLKQSYSTIIQCPHFWTTSALDNHCLLSQLAPCKE